ncbi:lysoplasmalogenase [Streptomyces sp. PSKA54]|uniref:Lysoplasmalogenase n=1 Tax=Streptomyces himalayensis subsp. aureolus TaxID=2758039 RepID=A0A7W2CVE2_9ACTN|nr:lysoplasmalogenase [Streptomyces himalayensis]MBA4859819.1 lysoplasmalogenase [Streptomyces himalayensis subsp. aureolus]
MNGRRERAARALLWAFALAAVADLVALAAGADVVHTVVKPLLMPLLAAHAAAGGGPRLLVGALLCGWAGDTLLLFEAEPAFLAGMAAFAVGHVCYLVLFGRLVPFARLVPFKRPAISEPVSESESEPERGLEMAVEPESEPNRAARARAVWLPVAYGVVLIGTVTLLWPDLPEELRGPVAAYSLLLTAMAYGAGRLGLAAGIGGALFLLSDTLIATGVAQWPQLPLPDLWIMGTYLAAQYLLTRGVLDAHRRQCPAATSGWATATP